MTDRPMTGEERAIEDARSYVERWDAAYKARGYVEPTTIRFARALLSTSAAVRGMREALKSIKRMPGPWISGPTGTARFLAYSAVAEVIDAVLSGIETEQEQARSPSALSASASTLSKDTTADLLEALKEARRYLDAVVANSGSSKRRENYAGAVRRIDAAITKAEGLNEVGEQGTA